MPVDRVILAEPRGFCAGVEKAIKALAWMVRVFEPPVYCYHEIVHNRHVVDQFVAQGVVFVDDVTEVPAGAPLMLSAHGSAPDVVDQARKDGRVVVDAVCPLVTKVHHELKVRARKGYTVLYVGHHGHEEAVGTMAVAPAGGASAGAGRGCGRPRSWHPADPAPTPNRWWHYWPRPPSVTTSGRASWTGPANGYPDLWMPNRSRPLLRHHQPAGRAPALAGRCDAVVVIGSENSSNTVALTKVAEGIRLSTGRTGQRRLRASRRPVRHCGVTAGASAPEALVDAVVERLAPVHGVELATVTVEEEYFPPPPELRDLLRGLEAAIGLLNSVPGEGTEPVLGEDRSTEAADVLEQLSHLS